MKCSKLIIQCKICTTCYLLTHVSSKASSKWTLFSGQCYPEWLTFLLNPGWSRSKGTHTQVAYIWPATEVKNIIFLPRTPIYVSNLIWYHFLYIVFNQGYYNCVSEITGRYSNVEKLHVRMKINSFLLMNQNQKNL